MYIEVLDINFKDIRNCNGLMMVVNGITVLLAKENELCVRKTYRYKIFN